MECPDSKILENYLRREYASFYLFAASRIRCFRLSEVSPEDLVNETVANILDGHAQEIFKKHYVLKAIANLACRQARQEQRRRKYESAEIDESLPEFSYSLRASNEDNEGAAELEERLERVFALLSECLEEANAPATIRKILGKDHGAAIVEGKPRHLAPEFGIGARTMSTYLHWIRKTIFPCVKRKFEGARQKEGGARHE